MISDRYPKCDATKGRSDPGIPGHKRTNSDAPQKALTIIGSSGFRSSKRVGLDFTAARTAKKVT